MEPRIVQTSSRPAAARARVWGLQTDAVLCRAASNGNELAFAELFRRHYPAVKAFVFHMLGARHRNEDAEDVVQDAFVRAFDAISGRHFSGDFKRWLFTIARNRSVDLLRGERVRLVSIESARIELGPQQAPATTTAAIAEAHEEVAWLVEALEALPERQRSALLLRELAGLSHDQIGEELGTSSASARQLIRRARDGVRAAADRDGLERESLGDSQLRRKLLDATPILPFAAAGAVASAGTTAGGSAALAKFAATVFAAVVLAGSAGPVSRGIAGADGAAATPATTQSADAGSRPGADRSASEARHADAPGHGMKSEFSAHAPAAEKPTPPGGDRPVSETPATVGDHQQVATENTTVESPAASKPPSPQAPQPVRGIVELPAQVVEQVAGDVLTDVTDTLDGTTSGLLGSGSGSDSR
ncbi:MAG: sigma-70 family RNA polymerase sigma factor [Thermoleophilaceae bacterium]|nr:sigma-70 family RNA polymerase sigma factor [Thermoleophilaceae bacterium]